MPSGFEPRSFRFASLPDPNPSLRFFPTFLRGNDVTEQKVGMGPPWTRFARPRGPIRSRHSLMGPPGFVPRSFRFAPLPDPNPSLRFFPKFLRGSTATEQKVGMGPPWTRFARPRGPIRSRHSLMGPPGFEPSRDLTSFGLAGFEPVTVYFWLLAYARRTEMGPPGFEPGSRAPKARSIPG